MSVSATLSSSLWRLLNLNRQDSVSPVGRQNAPAAAPEQTLAQSPASSSATPAVDLFSDEFQQASNLLQNWATKFGSEPALPPVEAVRQAAPPSIPDLGGTQPQSKDWSTITPVLHQTTDTNCGAAVATMLADAAGAPKTAPDSQRMAELQSKFTDEKGTTPLQLSNMLAHEGLGVKQAYGSVDQQRLDEALGKGQKIAAQVDSNRILPGATNADPAGRSHWVVVDGKDDKGNYTVKDPGTGKSYSVGLSDLTEAVRSGWDKHNAGGVLIVENSKGQASEAQLAEEGSYHASALGNGPGVGSDARASFGRESS